MRDVGWEMFAYYYEKAPVSRQKLVKYTMRAVIIMTKSSFFFLVCMLSIIVLTILAAFLQVPVISFFAGVGIGAITITMLTAFILRLFENPNQ